MENIEANLIRSFAEVRKEISNLQDQIDRLKNKKSAKTKSKKTKR